jgi:hypothetical protein
MDNQKLLFINRADAKHFKDEKGLQNKAAFSKIDTTSELPIVFHEQ